MLKQLLLEWVLKRQSKKMIVSEDYRVETYLEKIIEFFDAAKAKERTLTVVYEFHDSGANDGAWTVSIAEGICTLVAGEPESYESKFYMTAETYRRILTGRLDISKLTYSTGAVRFFGNTLAHRELNEYLTIPKHAGVAAL
jgi:hypothetical protein